MSPAIVEVTKEERAQTEPQWLGQNLKMNDWGKGILVEVAGLSPLLEDERGLLISTFDPEEEAGALALEYSI